ncbi:acetyl coenzyme A transporter [Histoplasma capsulatum]|uniref:Acetyl coenzyme A transporter n=1 Tax=Ajellomyces capsulatus TaxID=5037 RepID=A0A8A1MDS8_AJECA|nr:acetyl coenzyme A transporter [Histoplasma capsulatum]
MFVFSVVQSFSKGTFTVARGSQSSSCWVGVFDKVLLWMPPELPPHTSLPRTNPSSVFSGLPLDLHVSDHQTIDSDQGQDVQPQPVVGDKATSPPVAGRRDKVSLAGQEEDPGNIEDEGLETESDEDNANSPSGSKLSSGEDFDEPFQPPGRSAKPKNLPMRRSKKAGSVKRRSSNRPGLSVVAGGENGHANSDMNSNVEMRRKDNSLDSAPSATQAVQLMNRSNFTLDDEPPTPQTPRMTNMSFSDLPMYDKRNFALLCLLYFLQGVPMGLAAGSVPFLLKPFLSYGQIGIFSLASYPYSLKLLWSPIVDAVWSRRFGRRKSWITPIQMISGIAMLYLGAVRKREEKSNDRDGILAVYKSMWGVLKLTNIHTLIIVHLIAKIGFQANDAVTSLKLIDQGFGQENMALVVLIDFPFEIGLGYYAGKWSNRYTPMRLWCWAFVARLFAALLAQAVVMVFPKGDGPIPTWYILAVIGEHVFSTFMMTVMFVAISAFHARIADPVIGGTYMTLLATVSNLGGTFPKFFILKLVDLFTNATCIPPTETPAGIKDPITAQFSCALEADKLRCEAGKGVCQVYRDGYYTTNIICVIIGTITFFLYIRPAVLKVQQLPLRAWRLNGNNRQA